MSDHYYSPSPGVKNDRRIHEEQLRGIALKFMTDAGVFSKTGVDYGTRVLLNALELKGERSVLDVGCGYGPIGLTIARLAPESHVTMIDVNERAVELSKENAHNNGIKNITVYQSDVYEAVRQSTFDMIVTNPPIRAGKEIVHRIFEEGYELLAPGGTMWVVIQKKQGAASAEAKLETLFSEVIEVTKDKGYRIYKAVK
ncbi:16S rRNA (guanine1207-N2)-methyltransferase [Paenibacillus algorifonticola]|uniref:16S rRNA (Guanine1207-N2)-methyltransferase n=1 Tax=Paenibacillus algorifonticola TaxID=684063 RepID=A0A1I2I5Y2_9BACL|nr:class I SAM-dependent methyltransferase [Paenibacillus algorifonticola]SFF37023.1 16S rRNA (guanine1207-N2)-methyltransferase [Paenibacillus algorifonticola]